MAWLKPTHTQECDYCHQAFIPQKRGTQRFCSASCRTTHCRKKKAGTLGRVTKLKGPGKGLPRGSFAETALAAATGALAANAVSQTAEYFAVTRGLVQQVTGLTHLVQQLLAQQANNTKMLGRASLTMLTKLGATKAEALQVLNTPFIDGATKLLPQPVTAPEQPVPAQPVPSIPLARPAQPSLSTKKDPLTR